MRADPRRLPAIGLGAAAVLAAVLVAACVPPPSEPVQIQASSPSVTYKYRNEQEFAQANQSAVIYCDQYQSVPRSAALRNDPDGSRVVVFDCMRTSVELDPQDQQDPQEEPYPQQEPSSGFNLDRSYTYVTEQQLRDGSLDAQNFCADAGALEVHSHIVRNQDGSKTVTYRCSN